MRRTLEVDDVGEEIGAGRRVERGKDILGMFKRRKLDGQIGVVDSDNEQRERAWSLESVHYSWLLTFPPMEF
ncbi:hypothetical protein V6N13_065401 [Hibiscus sabdariffa]|uniref:Uncharacterized protein n=1 Tax=Hibiscus sabdariffa TaxID=183260 RepID=A0ABR2QQY9_9ROSI